MRFANHQGRGSEASTVVPIWANGIFKPALVRLIRCKSELLLGMDIVRALDIAVIFGGDRCKFGLVGWGMMTSNGKNHWVFPLCPTSCAYAKSNGYFGKLRGSEIDVLEVQGDFG